MSILGAHMSIAGGYYRAAESAGTLQMDTVQIFTKNNNQWRAKPITDDEAARFRDAIEKQGLRHPIAHASYLINLATPDRDLWKKSVEAMVVELRRAEQLGLEFVVVHPGAHTTASEKTGLRNVCRALDEIDRQTSSFACRCLLETTAGQGTCLGWNFEQLAHMLDGVRNPDRLGICFDTCHVFAAGYSIVKRHGYRSTLQKFDELIGVDRIRAFHLNDSKRELGSRVDRHAHIGEGHLGLEPFRWLLRDRRFRRTPMYLETPKGTDDTGRAYDAINLERLRKEEGSKGRKARANG